MDSAVGLEPTTSSLGNWRSDPLSYAEYNRLDQYKYKTLDGAVEFESTTFCLEDRISDPLSYAPVNWLGREDSNLQLLESESRVFPIIRLPNG